MTDILYQANWLFTTFGEHFRNALIQGSIALLLVNIICRLFPKMPPNTASWLWRLAYLKMLVAFVFVGSISLPVLREEYTAPTPVVITNALQSSQADIIAAPVDYVAKNPTAPPVLALIWYAGYIVIGLRIALASRKTWNLRRACIELENEELQDDLTALCEKMNIRRAPKLLTGDVSVPMICGFVSPCIILPERVLADSDQEELRLILAHELAHIKRKDVLWAWLPMLTQLYLFFNPLVWIFHREWIFTQEAACDSIAIQATDTSQADYGRMLVSNVVQARGSSRLVAFGVVEPYETLKRRLTSMSKTGSVSRKKLVVTGIIIVVIALMGVVPWTLRVSKYHRTMEAASILANAAYTRDVSAFQGLFSGDSHKGMREGVPSMIADVSPKVKSYGAVKEVVLESNERILPGLSGKGYSSDPRPGLSTWKVIAEKGSYRIGLYIEDGQLVGFVYNLQDMGIGSGRFEPLNTSR